MYVECLSITDERSQIHVCSSSVMVAVLTLFRCVVRCDRMISAILRMAPSDVIPFHGLQFVSDVWATFAGRRRHHFLLSGFKTPPRATSGQYSHVLNAIARFPAELNTTVRDVWSTFARHRYNRLMSSVGVEPFRARCVVHVRTSSLLTIGDRTLCYYCRRDVWSMFARPRCPHWLSSASNTTARCVINVRNVITVIGCDYRGSDSFATTIAAVCGQCLHVSLPSLAIVGDRALLLLLSPRCVISAHTSSPLSLVIVADLNHFATTIAAGYLRTRVMFDRERLSSLAHGRRHRLILSGIGPRCYYHRSGHVRTAVMFTRARCDRLLWRGNAAAVQYYAATLPPGFSR